MGIYVGMDIGGTNVKAGIVDEKGTLNGKVKFPTKDLVDSGDFTASIAHIIEDLLQENPGVEGIGIGVPGTLSKDRLSTIELPNIPVLNHMPLGSILDEYFNNLPLYFENDANLAALGEYYFGGANRSKNFIFVTLGTGVGGSAIFDGHLFTGADGNGMELGHVLVKNGKTLEQNIGKAGIMTMTKSLLKNGSHSILSSMTDYDPKVIAAEGLNGDALAVKVFQEVGEFLGESLVSAIRLLDVKNIVIGGGLAMGFDLLINTLIRTLTENLTPYYVNDIIVRKAMLGNDAGIMGAAALCMEKAMLSR
jgi:glucokinase